LPWAPHILSTGRRKAAIWLTVARFADQTHPIVKRRPSWSESLFDVPDPIETAGTTDTLAGTTSMARTKAQSSFA
jgi:seryl-tRNA(Sec) selenium transferase